MTRGPDESAIRERLVSMSRERRAEVINLDRWTVKRPYASHSAECKRMLLAHLLCVRTMGLHEFMVREETRRPNREREEQTLFSR